ncbi:MAG TPA: TIGR01777 family oxidoreductase [Candidatus Nanopelagicales bacterium]
MRIAVTGASGLIGTALVPHLRRQGHDVLRLVRGAASAPDAVRWDPMGGTVDLRALEGIDAAVHLAGAGVGDHRWTDAYKAEIRDSRVRGTDTIARAMAGLERRPSVLVSGSAIGFYGDTGDRAVDESAEAGTGFLADVVVAWEAAADPAREAGIRVVHPRTGLVVAGRGGAWGRLWPIFKLGGGGRLGSGHQWWSFISLRDEVAALTFLLDHVAGPVNLTAPTPATNAEVTTAMGRLLKRPTLLPVPAKALELALGEFSSEVLGSARVLPNRLLEAGFVFQDPTIEQALAAALAAR